MSLYRATGSHACVAVPDQHRLVCHGCQLRRNVLDVLKQRHVRRQMALVHAKPTKNRRYYPMPCFCSKGVSNSHVPLDCHAPCTRTNVDMAEESNRLGSHPERVRVFKFVVLYLLKTGNTAQHAGQAPSSAKNSATERDRLQLVLPKPRNSSSFSTSCSSSISRVARFCRPVALYRLGTSKMAECGERSW